MSLGTRYLQAFSHKLQVSCFRAERNVAFPAAAVTKFSRETEMKKGCYVPRSSLSGDGAG